LAHSEPAFYILDTVPMFLFSLTFLVIWAPQILAADEDVVTEMTGA
jgi:hypothetical protein